MYRRKSFGKTIVHRWEGNPLIGIDDLDFKCSDIRNAGAVRHNGEVLLLVTIEHLSGTQCIHLARTGNGRRFHVDKTPFLSPSTEPPYRQHEYRGVLDARVTFINGAYYIMYLAMGEYGTRFALAKTEDFSSVERVGIISEPETKAGVLFPVKIRDRYARLERPSDGSIWLSYSDDLVHWGGSEVVLSPRPGFWDTSRVGAGPPLILCDPGWLLVYYSVKNTSAGPLYRLGAALLDKEDPAKIIERCNIPVLSPRETYERIGDIPNLVFSTGMLRDEDGTITIYYGASDSVICIATTTTDKIVYECTKSKEEF